MLVLVLVHCSVVELTALPVHTDNMTDLQMSQVSQTAQSVLGDGLDLVFFNESVEWTVEFHVCGQKHGTLRCVIIMSVHVKMKTQH